MEEATHLYNKFLLPPGEKWLTCKDYLQLANRLKGEREKRENNGFLELPVTFNECFKS